MKSLYQVDMHRHEEVSLLFYFGRDIPDHKKIKMGLIRCLTYFGSAISDIHLETGKISLKTYFLDYD